MNIKLAYWCDKEYLEVSDMANLIDYDVKKCMGYGHLALEFMQIIQWFDAAFNSIRIL